MCWGFFAVFVFCFLSLPAVCIDGMKDLYNMLYASTVWLLSTHVWTDMSDY